MSDLTSFRQKGAERLKEIGLPTRSHEAFRYVPLREFCLSSFKQPQEKKLDKTLFSSAILPECIHSHIVFVDGIFSPHLSDLSALPEKTLLTSLEDFHGSFLQNALHRSLKEETDPFALLNLSTHPKGAFLYLPPKLNAAAPLQCLYVATEGDSALLSPRLHLALGAHSSLRCIFTTHGIGSHCAIPTLEISLEDGAHLDLINIIDPSAVWHFETLRAQLKKNATLHSLSIGFGGKAVRQSYRVRLAGENSEAHLNGLFVLDDHRTAHTHAVIDHEAPHTRSLQKFKSVLNGHSQSSFEGKILVRPEAQKTEAYQLNNNLLLSQGAIANSKPNLEVFADDVKASHGATISQLDDEQLFYLNTRGIDQAMGRQLLINGFCGEMIGKIPYDSLLQKLNTSLKLSHYAASSRI